MGWRREFRLFGLDLIERVKDGPCDRIYRSNLQVRRSANEADIDVIVEVKRARRIGRDQKELRARFGKDKGLRRSRDIEGLEKGSEVSVLFVEIEPGFSAVDLSLKVSDRFGESIGVGFCDGFLLDFRTRRPHAQERESQHGNNQDDTANSQKSLRHHRDYSPL